MKSRQLLLSLFALIVSSSFGQTYFTESFEGTWLGINPSPANMGQSVIQNGTGSGSNIYWNQSVWSNSSWSPAGSGAPTTAAPNGTAAARFNDYSAKLGEIVLLSSVSNIDLSSSQNPVCEFYFAYKAGNVKLKLVASTDGGSTWNDISSDIAFNGGAWEKLSYTLPALYKVSTARIGFKITGSFGTNGFWLDNIIVKESLVPLHGIKTIAPTGADYSTLNAAVNDMIAKGIDGAITFQVAAATYNEQVIIPNIIGASSTNTISFVGTNATSCIINTNTDDTQANYTIKLNGIDYLTLNNLTIRHNVGFNSRVLELAGAASNNTFTNCVFDGIKINSDIDLNGSRALLFSSNSADSANVFSNCNFKGGSSGVYFANLTDYESSNSFTNNTFEGFTNYGLQIDHQTNFIFNNNTINSSIANADAEVHGMRIVSSNQNLTISGNKFNLKGSNYCEGIYLNSFVGGSSNNPVKIYNNFIICENGNTSGQCIGINSYKSSKIDIANNSVLIKDGSALQSNCLYLNSDGSNFQSVSNRIVNNVLANLSGGVLLNFSTQSVSDNYIKYCNHNVLFSSDSNLVRNSGTLYRDIASWGAASNFDTNSLFIDPHFVSISDLHIADSYIDSVGIPVSYITIDIDGETRSTTIPDAGADECFIITSIQKLLNNSKSIIVYPNPATETIYFKGIKSETIITINDLTGKTIQTELLNSSNASINISGLDAGLYIIQIQNNFETKTLKFQKLN
ncbi:MAG: T9SS type A sorting domain-containing protein [Bacteroidota bacterium]